MRSIRGTFSSRCGLSALVLTVVGLSGLGLTGLGPSTSAAADLSPTLLAQVKAATVFIKLEIASQMAATGSGFVIRVAERDVYIATNAHVVNPYFAAEIGEDEESPLPKTLPPGFPKLTVVFHSGTPQEVAYPAKLLACQNEHDLAVIKLTVPAGTTNLPKAINLLGKVTVRETMKVYMLGFPFGKALAGDDERNPAITVSTGTVSSIRQDAIGRPSAIQLDGNLNPGNSGGPVLDPTGKLVGVAVATIRGSGIGFAVPAEHLTDLLEGSFGKPAIRLKKVRSGTAEIEFRLPSWDPYEKGRYRDFTVSYMPVQPDYKLPKASKGEWPAVAAAGLLKVTLARNATEPTLMTAEGKLTAAAGAKLQYVLQASAKIARGVGAGKVTLSEPVLVTVDFRDGAEAGPVRTKPEPPDIATVKPPMMRPDTTRPDTTRPDTTRPAPAPTGAEKAAQLKSPHRGAIRSLRFSPQDPRMFASVGDDGVLLFWNFIPGTGWQQRTVNAHDKGVRAVAWAPDGREVCTAGSDNTIAGWDPTNGERTFRRGGFGLIGPTCVAYSPDGKYLAIGVHEQLRDGSKVGLAEVMTRATGRTDLPALNTATDRVGAVAFTADSRLVLTGTIKNRVIVWDVTGELKDHTVTFPGPEILVTCVATSSTGRIMAWATDNGEMAVIDYRNNQPDKVFTRADAHTAAVRDIAISPGGGVVATASDDKTICLWKIAPDTNQPFAVLRGHATGVTSLSFSADGALLASSSSDGTVIFWRLIAGK